MTPQEFQQLLTELRGINLSLNAIVSAKSDKFKTGFDSKLAPKVVNIERGGEDGNSCLSLDRKPLPYRTITGIAKKLIFESGVSDDYGKYTLVFLVLETDDGIINLKAGMMPKPSVGLKNILYGLSQLPPGQQLVTLEFTPNAGTSEKEKKIVNVNLRDSTGAEVKTAFPKEKGTDRDTTEIKEYWEQLLLDVTNKLESPSATRTTPTSKPQPQRNYSEEEIQVAQESFGNQIAQPIKASETQPKQQTVEPPIHVDEASNFSEVIAATNIQLKRLGWTNVQGRDHLVKTYNKRSRQLLTDEELRDFLIYLKLQPTPSVEPASTENF